MSEIETVRVLLTVKFKVSMISCAEVNVLTSRASDLESTQIKIKALPRNFFLILFSFAMEKKGTSGKKLGTLGNLIKFSPTRRYTYIYIYISYMCVCIVM